MIDYTRFDVEDFAADPSFSQWVLQDDQDEHAFWTAYLAQHPELRTKTNEARRLLLNLKRAQQKAVADAQVKRIWSSIDREISAEPLKTAHRRTFMLAASIALVVGLAAAIALWVDNGLFSGAGLAAGTTADDQQLLEEVNHTDNVVRIHLSDGSLVDLEPNSRLTYPKDFTDLAVREVRLSGEAYFEVAKNPQQPFFVYANEVVTKVLGTAFRVKAFDADQNIVVAVQEGKVSVYSTKEPQRTDDEDQEAVHGVVLTPNQQVVYTRKQDLFNKSLVSAPLPVDAKKAKASFNFKNTPASEVFTVLGEAYGIEVIYDAEALRNCSITVPLGDEPLQEKLDVICRTIGAGYEVIEAKIVINSQGCGLETP